MTIEKIEEPNKSANLLGFLGVIGVKSAVYNSESKQLELIFTSGGPIPAYKGKTRKFKIDMEEILKELE
ncbi:MAG TPA: hypothetical protein VJ438_00085 [Candidatus Nanoarchaeia archaeon]|nr:hypothetical protein [Candidatus Nanoarchaeia archaeon]